MFQFPIVLWVLLTVVFLLLEGGTVALVSLWFAIGSIGAGVICLLGGSFSLQIAAFLLISAGLLVLLRPMLRKYMKITKTNVDSVIGSQGLVTVPIDNIRSIGEVKLGAMTWTARSSDETPIPAGVTVQVDRIEGVKVFVTPVPAEKL